MTASTGLAGRARSSDADDATASSRPARDWRTPLTIAIPALVAYVPLLLTHQGMVGADTKTYLYLDPAQLLRGAPYVWDYQIGLGTVTHQNIGYLFPMGPFYLFFDAIGVPDWVAQRLWLATVMFLAAMGVRYLLRTLGSTRMVDTVAAGATGSGAAGLVVPSRRARGWPGLGPWGVLVASVAYMLSPYILDYSARISVILLPWAALPWLIALAAKAVRHGGWRYPAWFAFVVLLVGGINATALIMIGWGPLLWILHAVFVDKEATPRQALAAVGRIAALTVATSLWWIAGLWAEGRYGLPVIRYTESYRTVAEVSNAPEVLRGLGYWFFYGNDKLGPWIEPSEDYTTHTWLLGLSYLLPILALTSAALVRWRYRAYFISLIVFGGLTAVASHPWKSPSIFGLVFKEYSKTDAGLSLRSTPRAVPLVVLGTAVFLGAGVDALGRRLPRFAVPVAVGAIALILANMPPMWNNTMVATNLERPEQIPSYWVDDANYLEARGSDTRVLEIPGEDFASYRWGNTVDPVLPGLMDRPYVARELFTWGSPQSANLLNALDRRFHEDSMDPQALAPVARLMGVGDINVRSDLQFERYRIGRPKQLWELIRRAPGLGTPVGFGPNDPPNVAGPVQTLVDEVELSTPPGLEEPPRVAAVPVQDPLPILRAQSASQPLLMAADGEGIVDAASQGLINPEQAIFYSATFAKDRAGFDRVYGSGADLMVTDTNRKRARRWGALRENTGYTERSGETPLDFDPTDQRLDVFPGAPDDAYTVSEQRPIDASHIGATVTATGYGNPITFTPDDRPANALDDDPQTAWRVGAIADVVNEKLFVSIAQPVTTDHINLLQPVNLERTRWITKAKLTFDRGTPAESSMDVDLTDLSRDESGVGQDIAFPSRTFQHLTIEVLDSNLGPRPLFDGVSGVGFAEVRIPGVAIEDLVRMPTDLLQQAGPSSIDHRLTLLTSRLRSNPQEPVRTDEEISMRRVFTLPTVRSFAFAGTGRLSAYRTDEQIDAILGQPDAAHGGVTARADVHLPGNLEQRASAAIDGDPATFWSSIYQKQVDHWIEYTTPAPISFDHLELDLVADGRHSLPTELRIDADGATVTTVDVPPVTDLPPVDGRPQLNRTVHVSVPVGQTVTGTTLRFTIAGVRDVPTAEWYSDTPTITPVAIAELGIPGLHLDPPGDHFDSGCRSDLVSVDGTPVPARMQGSTEDALRRQALPITACTPSGSRSSTTSAGTVDLAAGEHILRTGIGRDTGLDVDRLALASDRGGSALPVDRLPSEVPAAPPTSGATAGRVDAQLTIGATTQPYWLVQGQSWSTGWHASVNGHDLGPPVTINGFANGWYVDPAVVGTGAVVATIEWTPQRLVFIFIGVSIVGFVVCLALMVLGRRPREPIPLLVEADRPLAPSFAGPWPWTRGRSATNEVSSADEAESGSEVAAEADGSSADARGAARRPGHASTAERPASKRVAALAAVAFGLFVAFDVPTMWWFPLLGVPAALVVYVVLRKVNSRGWLGLAGAGCLALAAAYFVVQQRRWRYKPNFVWPILFNRVDILGLLAIFFLGAEAVREIVLRRRRPESLAGRDAAYDLSPAPESAAVNPSAGGPEDLDDDPRAAPDADPEASDP